MGGAGCLRMWWVGAVGCLGWVASLVISVVVLCCLGVLFCGASISGCLLRCGRLLVNQPGRAVFEIPLSLSLSLSLPVIANNQNDPSLSTNAEMHVCCLLFCGLSGPGWLRPCCCLGRLVFSFVYLVRLTFVTIGLGEARWSSGGVLRDETGDETGFLCVVGGLGVSSKVVQAHKPKNPLSPN